MSKGIAGSLGNSKMLHCLPLNINFHNNSKPITFRPFSTKGDSYNFNSLNLKKLILTPIGHDECIEIN